MRKCCNALVFGFFCEFKRFLFVSEAARNPVLIFQKELLAALQSSDVQKLQNCLSCEFLKHLPAELPGGLEQSINLPILEGNTPLHIASKSQEPHMIR